MQLEFFNAPKSPTLTLRDISYGTLVQSHVTKKLLMKVKPTGFLLNSTVVGAVLNRADCLVVDVVKGTLYCVQGDIEVTVVKAKLHITL